MIHPRTRLLAALIAPLLGAAPALAQPAPPLPTMPPPPSASDPVPKESAAKKARKPARKAAAGGDDAGGGTKAAARAKRTTGEGYDRPGRYVPEEFDQGGGAAESRVKPYMGEGGRAGMGMRF